MLVLVLNVLAVVSVIKLRGSEAECTSTIPQLASAASKVTVQGSTKCPTLCRCASPPSAAYTTVDCSGTSLLSVPFDLPADTCELNLDDNNIATLTSASFRGCSKLRKLSVAGNKLSRIEKNSFFAVAASLEELHLNDNDLILNDSSKFKVFDGLDNLVVLSLYDNVNISDEIFKNQTKLTSLSIDRAEFVEFGSLFQGFLNLRSLRLYGKMRVMSNGSLENLFRCPLKELKIKSQNTLRVLEPLTFANLSSLETLDLSFNQGLDFTDVSKAWYGLQFTRIKSLILSRIIINENAAPRLTTDFYQYLHLCQRIENLLLDRNNIVTVEEGLAAAFSNLKRLEFSYNRMSNIAVLVYETFFMRRLQFIDFSYQTKRYLNPQSVGLKQQIVMYQNAREQRVSKDFECKAAEWKPCPFTSETMLKGPIKDKSLSAFGPWCFLLPRSLDTLNLTSSLDVEIFKLPQIVMLGSPAVKGSVKTLIYQGNGLTAFTGPVFFSDTHSRWSMDLSDNGATCLAPDILKLWIERGGTIVKFSFENNDIGQQLEHDINGTTFQHYHRTSEVNLARNNIKILPYDIFFNLTSLTHLNLSGNSLRLIEFKFDHFNQLSVLDLSNNLVTDLNVDILRNLKGLFVSSNMTLYLTGNPIQCSCESIPFLSWMSENNANLYDFAKISCLFNNSFVSFDKLSDYILVHLQFQCSSNLLAIISAVLLLISILAIVFSVFLYRHRWDIRYYLNNLRRKRDKYQLLTERSLSFVYDAFVSFDHNDNQWVRQELMRHLESAVEHQNFARSSGGEEATGISRELSLCVHERDFEAGNAIGDNIFTAIVQSRKVIIVLTNNFLRSHWCNYELEMGRMQSLERGRNILVPIVLTHIELADMPSCLQWLILRKTYIRWNEDECPADREEFWARLRRVLNDSGLEPWICECGRTVFDENNAHEPAQP